MFWRKYRNYLTFSVRIKKVLDNGETITYKVKFIDIFRFMSSSLSRYADNLYEGLHDYKCTDLSLAISTICWQLIFQCIECSTKIKITLIKFN